MNFFKYMIQMVQDISITKNSLRHSSIQILQLLENSSLQKKMLDLHKRLIEEVLKVYKGRRILNKTLVL